MFGKRKKLEAQILELQELRSHDREEIQKLRSGYTSVEQSAAMGATMALWNDEEVVKVACRRAARVGDARDKLAYQVRKSADEMRALTRQLEQGRGNIEALRSTHEQVVAALREKHAEEVRELTERADSFREVVDLFRAAARGELDHNFDAPPYLLGSTMDALHRIIADQGGDEAKRTLAAVTERHEIVKKRLEDRVEYLTDVKNQRDHALTLLATQVQGVTETTVRELARGEEIAEKRELIVEVDKLTGSVRFGFQHPDVP